MRFEIKREGLLGKLKSPKYPFWFKLIHYGQNLSHV